MKFGALLLKDQESSLVTGLFVFRISFALDKCPYLQCTVTCDLQMYVPVCQISKRN